MLPTHPQSRSTPCGLHLDVSLPGKLLIPPTWTRCQPWPTGVANGVKTLVCCFLLLLLLLLEYLFSIVWVYTSAELLGHIEIL